MGIALVKGRDFTRRDDDTAPRVAIVNQHLADHYWPNQDPLGKRFRLKMPTTRGSRSSASPRRASTSSSPSRRPIRLSAVPAEPVRIDVPAGPVGGRSGLLAAPLREMVRGLDVSMPIFNVRTMEELYRMRAVSIFNVLVTTVGAMGLMGLGLSIVGLYGLVAYAASRRTREIGIRMALGATAPTVLRMVLRHGLTLALTGLALGLAASVGAGGLLSAAFPSGNDRRDLMSLFLIAPVVFIATLLAVYIPAGRAARVNPVVALRYE